MGRPLPELDALVGWVIERDAMRRRRAAGETVLTADPILAKYRFCNVNVQDDHVSRVIFDTITQPYAEHPGLIVGLTVCRFTNEPEVIEAIKGCIVPFDAERFVAIMADRKARGLSLSRRAYVIPGGAPGELKAASLTRDLFKPLSNSVEAIRPKPGDTCEAVFERLRRFPYLESGFLTAQIVRDLKQVEPLRSASDWKTFVRSGPGSQRGVNRVCGATTEAEIERKRPEAEWRALFEEIVDLAAPRVAEHGIELDAQSWQNVFCETDKFLRFRSGNLHGARRYAPDGKAPARRAKRKLKPAIAPAADVGSAKPALPAAPMPAPRAIPELAAARDPYAPHVLFHDLETRSAADLKAVGAWRYAVDPTTEVLCLAYAVDDEPVQLWVPGKPVPSEFMAAANEPNWQTTAHNDAFERLIARHVLEPRYGFPAIPLERRRCSMAMALAAALPAKLEKAAEALGLSHQKDKAGHALMLRMSKPLRGGGWIEDPANLERLYAYCRQDVRVERALRLALPALTADEQKLWELDARINDRGFAVDAELLAVALQVVDKAAARLQAEFRALTGLNSTNQVEKFVAWLAAHGCDVTDVRKATLGHALRRKNLDPAVRRAIELRKELAHASAAKVKALLNWRGDDGRVRGAFQFHGAATGRWTGRGPQPQNFKRDGDGIDGKIAAITAGGVGLASPVEAVGDIARAFIRAAPGHRLFIGDFSGIESRVLAWVSGQQSKLDQWAKFDRTGDANDHPYMIMGRSLGHSESTAYAFGKIGELAFGYQGGVGAWRNFAPDDDDADETKIKSYRDRWRANNPRVVHFWYSVDRAAINAVRKPGTEYQVREIRFRFEPPWLRIVLPSGRPISYPFPRIETNRFDNTCVVFSDNAGGKWTDCGFGRGFYGGAWTENIVSGIARDLLAAALQRLEAAGLPATLHIHDELVCEVAEGFGNVEEFQRIVTTVPDWAAGLPVAAKVREFARFSKPDESATAASNPEPSVDAEHDAGPAVQGAALNDPLADLLDEAVRQGDIGSAETVGLAGAGAEREAAPPPPPPPLPSWEGAPEPARGNGRDQHSYGGNGFDRAEYPHGESRGGQHIATYLYRDQLGNNHTRVEKWCRPGARAQYPQSFWSNGCWMSKKPAEWLKIPYRLPEMLAALAASPGAGVLIPEGEKDADTLAALGLIATTSSEGATPPKAKISNWTPELNRWFGGAKRAFILEDNDEAGRKFAREKAHALAGIVPDVRIVTFPDVPEGEDVSWWLAHGHGKAELLARCEAAPRWEAGELESVRASSVEMEAFDWLWFERFALGKIGIIAGLPDEGKGQVLAYVAAHNTNENLEWPNGEGRAPQGNVILLTAEDDPADTVVPRFAAAGADLARIEIVKMVRDHDEKTGQPRKRMFNLATDLEKLRQKIIEVGNVVAVMIDPISAYLGIGKIDSFRDSDVRSVLGPLKELAAEMRVAILAVMHFNKKTDVINALLRISNSIAFSAASRHAYGIIEDAEHGRTLMVRAKNNLVSKADAKNLAFHFEERQVGTDRRNGKPIRAPFIVFNPGYVDVTATEALQAAAENKSPGQRDKAKQFLLAMLAGGPAPVKEIEEAAAAQLISKRTLERAKEALGIVVDKDRSTPGGKWFWALP